MRTFLGFLASLAITFSLGLQVSASDRVALVVGNGSYQHAPVLTTPVSDAKAMAAALKRLDFEVVEGYDLNIDQMRAVAADFSAKLVGTKTALIYFAGHAGAMDDENFLIPVDASFDNRADVQSRAISANVLLREMEGKEDRASIVILDACRDNPFGKAFWDPRPTTWKEFQYRPPVRYPVGLSAMDTGTEGVLIAFPTDPGSTVRDDDVRQSSPFTAALLKHVETPGVSIFTVMDWMREEVWIETGTKQKPWVSTSIIGEITLKEPIPPGLPNSGSAETLAGDHAKDLEMWRKAAGGTAKDYEAYLAAFPNGQFAVIAKGRLARLR